MFDHIREIVGQDFCYRERQTGRPFAGAIVCFVEFVEAIDPVSFFVILIKAQLVTCIKHNENETRDTGSKAKKIDQRIKQFFFERPEDKLEVN
jgi:hypothetical protein